MSIYIRFVCEVSIKGVTPWTFWNHDDCFGMAELKVNLGPVEPALPL
jgi:hypothetical protein